MDESVWASEPYTQQDLVNQVNYVASQPGGAADLLRRDQLRRRHQRLHRAGQAAAQLADDDAGRVRGARAPQGPQPFTLENLVSIATLVGGIFGNGGGDQLSNAILYENMAQKFGGEHYVVAGSPR